MHGEITVSSDDPPGTRIDIALPLADRTQEEPNISDRGIFASELPRNRPSSPN